MAESGRLKPRTVTFAPEQAGRCASIFYLLAQTGSQCSMLRGVDNMLLRHLVFEVIPHEDGTWTAVGIGDDIFTQGSDFEDLKVNALEAVRAHFHDEDCDKFEVRLAQVVSQFVFAA
jgi:hypothetical protein